MIIEWNHHLFHAGAVRYPSHPKAAYRPEANHFPADPLADYLAHMDTHAIDRAILVHPEPYGDDHRLALDSLEREPERFLDICLLPGGPGCAEKAADAGRTTAAHHGHALSCAPRQGGLSGEFFRGRGNRPLGDGCRVGAVGRTAGWIFTIVRRRNVSEPD